MLSQLPKRAAVFGLYTAVLLAANVAVLRALVALGHGNATASHHIAVPFVTLMLLYLDRAKVFAACQWSKLGGVILALGVGLMVVARVGGVGAVDPLMASVAGLVIGWLGGFLLCFGWNATRAALFPLLFLVFAIPIPAAAISEATAFLKEGSTDATAMLFSVTGTPYNRDGFTFFVPGFAIEVADECSGIRSGIATVMTSLLAGHGLLHRTWAKTLLVLVSVPVTIVKYGIRIVSLTLLATHVDPGFLTGQLHHEGGIAFFAVGLVLLFPFLMLLRRLEGLQPGLERSSA